MHTYGFYYKQGKREHLIDIRAENEDKAKIKLVAILEDIGLIECLGRQKK